MKRLADRSDATVMRMYRTIEDLTDLRAIELGVMKIERRPTDVRALVEHVLCTLGPHERSRVEVECTAPLCVIADAARVARVVSRLLHLHLAASTPGMAIKIVLERRGERAVIAMLGPASAMLDASASAPASPHLGLYVARHAIEAHGGSITAYEQPGAGTWLVLALPVPTCDIRRRAAAFAASILIVAEDICHGSALAQLMRDDGFSVDFVRSGGEALRLVASRCPDAVVVDEELSETTAAELVRRLQTTSPGLPTIIVRRDGADFYASLNGASVTATSRGHVSFPAALVALYAELGHAIRRSVQIAI